MIYILNFRTEKKSDRICEMVVVLRNIYSMITDV